jgi:UDP-glucose 4-epimerase
MEKIKVLVTGGAGFIGSHVAEALVKRGYEVVVLDDLSGGLTENVPKGAEFVEGSVTDDKLLASLLKCFVFTSSIAVYGANQVPMLEEMTPHPEDPYGISKYAVELDLEAAHHQFGLNSIIFRPHNVYGEKQNIGDKYRNVLGIFMNKILQGENLTIFGDVAPVIAESITNQKAYNQVFNIGGDQEYTVKHLAEVIAKAMGVQPDITYLKARNEVTNAYSSHEKIRQFFTLKKPTALETGIQKMATWVKATGSRKTKAFKNIEIREGLPEGW